MNVADYLEASADLIEVHGHVKDELGDERQGFCAIGAMAAMAHMCKDYREQFAEALDALDSWVWNHYPDRIIGGYPVRAPAIRFNNHELTTAAEVIDAMKMTAKEWRNTHVS
jgi:hypothetical protein